MSKLAIIVEGQTERGFVQKHLAGHLRKFGISTWAVLAGPRGRGGVQEWNRAKGDMVRILRSGHHCSTMFDYYGLPSSWPGRPVDQVLTNSQTVERIEAAILDAVAAEMGKGFDRSRFVPYIQLHEFEALMFADVEALASVLALQSGRRADALTELFQAELASAGNDPEAIDNGYETCPSRRILRIVPRYKKVAHGSIIASRIGLKTLRARCRHFGEWLERLEGMARRE